MHSHINNSHTCSLCVCILQFSTSRIIMVDVPSTMEFVSVCVCVCSRLAMLTFVCLFECLANSTNSTYYTSQTTRSFAFHTRANTYRPMHTHMYTRATNSITVELDLYIFSDIRADDPCLCTENARTFPCTMQYEI